PAQALQQLQATSGWQQEGFSRSYTRITYWLQFRLPATAFNGNSRWLETGPNFIDDIRLYLKPANSQTGWQLLQAGDFHPTLDATTGIPRLDYRGAVFSLPATTQQQDYDVLVRLQSSSTMMFFIRLWQPEDFLHYSGKATAFWSFYTGIALLSALLALVMAMVLKTPLLWAATAFSSAYLLVVSVQGFWTWLFPQALAWQHYSTSISTLTTYSSSDLHYSGKATAFWSFYTGIALLSALLALVMAMVLKTPLLWAATAFSSAYLLVVSVQGFWTWLFPQALAWQHYSTSIFTLTTY